MHGTVTAANWNFHWRLTESAGLMVFLADFRGKRVLWEGSLPYVTVDHQRDALDDADEMATALTDAHGPWWVPLGARNIVGAVRVTEFRGGVELAADFSAGPYHYTQFWRFSDDGRLSPWLMIHGAGLHDHHTYHPHWRFDFDLNGAMHDAFEHFEEGRWRRITHEGWFPYGGEADDNGAVWRQVDDATGAAIFLRPHIWDDAEVYAIRYHDGEWAPFSPRASAAAAPFPAAYLGEEPIDGKDIALWYVAHIHYDQSFPYTAGPWIRVEGL